MTKQIRIENDWAKIEAGDTVRSGWWVATVIKSNEKMSKIKFHNTQAVCWINNDRLVIVQ